MRTSSAQKNSRGFLIIQVLISIIIIVILATIVALSLGSFREHQELTNAIDGVTALVNEAHSRTLAAEGGTVYGVHLDTSDAVLFAGSTYVPGDPSNQTVTLEPAIEIDTISLAGAGSDIVFDMLTGDTDDYGTFKIDRVSTTLGAKTLTVTKTGAISSN